MKKKPTLTPQEKAVKQVQKHNLDTMRLLAHYPRFQERVEALRQNLKIPPNGFAVGSNEALKWHRQRKVQENIYWIGKSFQNQEKELLSLLAAKKITWRKYSERMTILEEGSPRGQFKEKIRKLTESSKLLPHFSEYVEKYVVFGKIDAPIQNWVIRKREIKVSNHQKAIETSLVIYGRITYEEWKALKLGIEALQIIYEPANWKKEKSRKNIKRDIEILKGKSSTDNDYDLVAKIFSGKKVDKSIRKDKARVEMIKQARRRLLTTFKERFGDD